MRKKICYFLKCKNHSTSICFWDRSAIGFCWSQNPASPGMVWIRKIRWVTQLRKEKKTQHETYIPCVWYVKCLGFLSHLVYHVWIPDMSYLIWSNRNQRNLFTYKGYLQELTSSSQRTGPRHRARKHSENSSVSIFEFIFLCVFTFLLYVSLFAHHHHHHHHHHLIGKMLVPLGWYPSCLTPQRALLKGDIPITITITILFPLEVQLTGFRPGRWHLWCLRHGSRWRSVRGTPKKLLAEGWEKRLVSESATRVIIIYMSMSLHILCSIFLLFRVRISIEILKHMCDWIVIGLERMRHPELQVVVSPLTNRSFNFWI